ncbi:MAG: hypothetical protein JST32_18350, partial [Bacteroidetes bacterium]|nr:hypothetical protein [Bacteroidota bacterium]
MAILLLFLAPFAAKAQNTFIPIETKDNAIVLHVTGDGYLNMVYFGKKLSDSKEYQNTPQLYHQDEADMRNS